MSVDPSDGSSGTCDNAVGSAAHAIGLRSSPSTTQVPQPRRAAADTAGVTIEQIPSPAEFYAALFIGELLLAGCATFDPFPPELDELARAFFLVYRPTAEA
jgi:hypothetical protein